MSFNLTELGDFNDLFQSYHVANLVPLLIKNGYKTLRDLMNFNEEDLEYIAAADLSMEEKQRLLETFQKGLYAFCDGKIVARWLRESGLDHYTEAFNSFQSLGSCARITSADLDGLGITLAAHKKRLLTEVTELQRRDRATRIAAVGHWQKHDHLPAGRHGKFLCVNALVQAKNSCSNTHNSKLSRDITFVVDTASDVVTLRREVVKELGLTAIEQVRCTGAHGVAAKTLFRAYVTIGKHEIPVEVICSEINSLGTPVFHEFTHSINSTDHYWIK